MRDKWSFSRIVSWMKISKMRFFTLLFLLISATLVFSQESIDGSFEFQTDPAKKYSLYIPSEYDENTPHALMLGLHPLNVNRWDGESWRDTLIAFAEMNNLLLVCPDGGIDGQIDSPIDTAFTTTLLDSVSQWYNINQEEKYVLGFSWGGKTTYTYGLRRTNEFKGYLVIGAAVTITEVNGIVENATNENFFLVHGSNDNPNTRFTPLRNALMENNACVGTNLMTGVGHTIDFPNRNSILTDAFTFLKDNVCETSNTQNEVIPNISVFPNPSNGSISIENLDLSDYSIEAVDLLGRIIPIHNLKNGTIDIPNFKGACFLRIYNGKNTYVLKHLIL